MTPNGISPVTQRQLTRGAGSISAVTVQHLTRNLTASEPLPNGISPVTQRQLTREPRLRCRCSRFFHTVLINLFFQSVAATLLLAVRDEQRHAPVALLRSATSVGCGRVVLQVKDGRPPVVRSIDHES